MVDVSKFGDMVIRDISVRSIKTTEDASISGNLDIKGKLDLMGNLDVKGQLLFNGQAFVMPKEESPEKEAKSVVLLNEQNEPKWRLVAIDDFLLFQKFIDGEWVNKQALT